MTTFQLTPSGWAITPQETPLAIANKRLPQGAVPFVHGDSHDEDRATNHEHALSEIDELDGGRRRLYELQAAVFALPDIDMPLQHVFAPGIYLRTIFIPKGGVVVGKIHRHRHGNVLSQGRVVMFTESGGVERMEGPLTMVSDPGTKRAVYAETDTYWTTVHLNPTETRDLAQLEREIIAESYEEYERENAQGV